MILRRKKFIPHHSFKKKKVAIRAPCCKKWFDCAECHAAVSDHPLRKTDEMVFACKKCKKVFRKDMTYVKKKYFINLQKTNEQTIK